MELHERITVIRKAMGLTQEQLGELVGVSRQAVSKWESGQTVPDALTIAALCQKLNLSADYVLLGKEPEEAIQGTVTVGTEPVYEPPEFCPACGREVKGTICPICGYGIPRQPPRGPRYAIVTNQNTAAGETERIAALVKYCGFSEDTAKAALERLKTYGTFTLLRRDLTDGAAHWMASHLAENHNFYPKIVEDCGETEDELLLKPKAMEMPEPTKEPMGFGGTVLAVTAGVILALVILSFF